MITSERSDLMYALGLNYLLEKERSKVWQREDSRGYIMAWGKLTGACMAFKLDYKEEKNSLIIFTSGKKRIVTEVKIDD